MDGSHFGPIPTNLDDHISRREPDPLPEREWSLSPGEVVVAVLAIVAMCEMIGLVG